MEKKKRIDRIFDALFPKPAIYIEKWKINKNSNELKKIKKWAITTVGSRLFSHTHTHMKNAKQRITGHTVFI